MVWVACVVVRGVVQVLGRVSIMNLSMKGYERLLTLTREIRTTQSSRNVCQSRRNYSSYERTSCKLYRPILLIGSFINYPGGGQRS